MAKYPIDTYSNGATYLDDSLTSLNWLHPLDKWRVGAGNEHIFKGGPFLNLQNIILYISGNKSKYFSNSNFILI
jgi:hypothetical protein